jgi:hypothetical protein
MAAGLSATVRYGMGESESSPAALLSWMMRDFLGNVRP